MKTKKINKIHIFYGALLILINLFLWRFINLYFNEYSSYISYKTLSHNYNFYLTIVGALLLNLGLYVAFFQKNYLPSKYYFYLFLIISGIALLTPPLGASDLFVYIFQGRILSTHNLSPYISIYKHIPSDIFFKFLGDNVWVSQASVYGPLFLMISGGLAALASKSFAATFYIFKLFFIGINILNAWIIKKDFGDKAFFLYAFNPLIFWEFAINSHNDVLVIFFILLGIHFLLKKTEKLKPCLISFGLLILSGLIKFTSFILLPIFWLGIIYKIKNRKNKIYFALTSLILSALLIILFYYPFVNSGQDVIGPIKTQGGAFSPLFTSPAILLCAYILYIFNFDNWKLAINFGRSIFVGGYLFLIINLWRNRLQINWNKIIITGLLAITLFFTAFFTWLMPWYLTTAITLAIIAYNLENNKKYLYLLYFLSFYGIIYYIVLR